MVGFWAFLLKCFILSTNNLNRIYISLYVLIYNTLKYRDSFGTLGIRFGMVNCQAACLTGQVGGKINVDPWKYWNFSTFSVSQCFKYLIHVHNTSEWRCSRWNTTECNHAWLSPCHPVSSWSESSLQSGACLSVYLCISVAHSQMLHWVSRSWRLCA